jgi:hypothetical protein
MMKDAHTGLREFQHYSQAQIVFYVFCIKSSTQYGKLVYDTTGRYDYSIETYLDMLNI